MEKEKKEDWLNYILFHVQQNLCVHRLITTFTLLLAIQTQN